MEGNGASGANSPARVNGFSQPRSRNQLISWIGQSVSLTIFYALLGSYLATGSNSSSSAILVVIHAVIVLLSFALWYFLETHSPVASSCWSKCLSGPRWEKTKYCRVHKAKIEGLDHYCEWLNVSIGRSNYVPFLLLVCLGCFQFTLQTAVGLLMFTLWRDDISSSMTSTQATLLQTGTALNVANSLCALCLYSMLLFFHSYLGIRGISTYDYTIEQTGLHRQARKQSTSASDNKTTPVVGNGKPSSKEMDVA